MSIRSGLVLILSCVLLTSSISGAQTQTQTGRAVKRNVAAVLFASLGGAILGLSTLPFYGEPHEHTGNISTGALIGLAAGLGYVIYDSTKPSGAQYEYSEFLEMEKLQNKKMARVASTPAMVQMSFDF